MLKPKKHSLTPQFTFKIIEEKDLEKSSSEVFGKRNMLCDLIPI